MSDEEDKDTPSEDVTRVGHSPLTYGIRGLIGSKKGTLTIMILVVVSVALFLGRIAGSEYIAALTILSTIYCATSAAVDIKNSKGDPP